MICTKYIKNAIFISGLTLSAGTMNADDTDPSLFKLGSDSASGGAGGIGLKLAFDGDAVTPNTATQYYPVEDLGSGDYGWTKNFVVTPVTTSASVTAGSLNTSLTYTLAYN